MNHIFDLTGRTAVIVGGTSTLGSSMAVGLAQQGARIALIVRDMKKSKAIEDRIRTVKGTVMAFQADITDEYSLKQAANEIEKWCEGWDILLNTSGKNSSTPFFELDMEEWDNIMDVNLKGIVVTSQIFASKMIEQGKSGSIINISSVSSIIPLSKVFTYSVSKAGVNHVTQFLAREFAPHGIRVNAIIPGFFPAEQNRQILNEERIDSIMQHTPMQRFGKPTELQGTVIWLASHRASSFVTGALIPVDGGFSAMSI